MLSYGVLMIVLALVIWSDGFRLHKPNGLEKHKQEKVKFRAEESLVLTHVLFRHGLRTPEKGELYPKDPYLNYDYYPLRHGDLTNDGKRGEYAIGTALRERYDNFLGMYYVSDLIDSWSTDRNRTKMSLLLVLASLFPPKCSEVWDASLNWQPIPYNSRFEKDDDILFGISCPNFVKELPAAEELPEIRALFNQYADTIAYISENTGLNITRFKQAYDVFFGLSTEEAYGLKLPTWTEQVWPEPYQEIAQQQYHIYTSTTYLKKIAAGYFIKKVLDDTNKKIRNETATKMFLYSGHENTIAQLLITLDVYEYPHVPTYGSYVLMEVHYINETYGLKIYYQDYKSTDPKLLKLPTCEEFCPLSTFTELVQEYLPEDGLCGH